MKIVLATPLYPPEIAEPAPYVKELAKRLSGRHAVTIVAYTRLPEKVSGVSIIVVDKHKPLFIRLVVYFFTLLRAAWHADIVYAMNGASVELPAALVALVTRRPFVFHIGDSAAHERAKQKQLLRFIERFAFARTKEVTADSPLVRPEIIPFEPFPAEGMAVYERSWNTHVNALEATFTHDT
ncbi:MAG: glycosyltransferase [Patescibacteria group bacterium]